MRVIIALAICVIPLTCAQATEPVRLGLWVASSEASTKLHSVVELMLEGDRLFGRIERVIDSSGSEVNAVCQGCPGDLKDKPMKGIAFITDLRREGNRWVGGKVINLEPGLLLGVTGNCELEIKDSHVEFFGYKGFRILGKHRIWNAWTH